MLLGFVNIYADVNEYFCALTGAVVLWANMQQENSSLHQLVYYFYFILFIYIFFMLIQNTVISLNGVYPYSIA